MGIADVFDKAGPALATGIVLAVLTGSATSLVAWGSHSADVEQFRARLARLEQQVEEFRRPGPRFTADDGARHERRIEHLEGQCAECLYSRAEMMQRLKHLEERK